jgi:hypothetical protein
MPVWRVQGQLALKLCTCERNKVIKATVILVRTMYFDFGILGCDTVYNLPSLFATSQIRG